VTSDYFTILKYRSQIEVDQDSVANLQAHLDNVNAQFRAGTIAKADILSSEVSLADKQQSLVTAQNNYQVAIATLNNDIGLETGTETIIKDDLKYTPYQLNLSECEQYALNYRPDILQKSYEVKEYDAAKESAKSGGRPQVTASANRSFGGITRSEQIIIVQIIGVWAYLQAGMFLIMV
jgi:outer membrane protein TolC